MNGHGVEGPNLARSDCFLFFDEKKLNSVSIVFIDSGDFGWPDVV